MDQLATFIQERWYVIVAAIVLILIIVSLVKTVLKWVIILAIAAALLFYGSNYIDDIKEIGTKVVSAAKDEAYQLMEKEGKDATYTADADGNYTVKSNHIQLDGKTGSDSVKVTVKGQTFTISLNSVVKTFIETAKQNKTG